MTRTIAALLLCLMVAGSAWAAPAKEPRWQTDARAVPGWQELEWDDTHIVFILDEPLDVSAWPVVQAWTRWEFEKVQRGEPDFRSMLWLEDYDCAKISTASRAIVVYAERNLDGEPLTWSFAQEDDPKPTYPKPNTVGHADAQAICALAEAQMTGPGRADSLMDAIAEASTPDALLAAFKEAGWTWASYVLIHDLFPTDWDVFARQALTLRQRGGHVRANELIGDFLAEFVNARAAYLETAPIESLRAIARARAKVMAALKARRVQSCASYALYDAITLDYAEMAPQEHQDVAEVWALQLRAIRQGMDTPTTRRAIGDADSERFAKLFLAKGGTADQWAAIFRGRTAALSPQDQCDGWATFLNTVADAPEPTASRVAAWYFGPSENSEKEAPVEEPLDPTRTS